MGIRPGAEKYSLGFGADVKNIPMQSPQANLTEMYGMPIDFNQSPPGYNQHTLSQFNEFPSNYYPIRRLPSQGAFQIKIFPRFTE